MVDRCVRHHRKLCKVVMRLCFNNLRMLVTEIHKIFKVLFSNFHLEQVFFLIKNNAKVWKEKNLCKTLTSIYLR